MHIKNFFPDDKIIIQNSLLLKEATSLKKQDISGAIEKIKQAIKLLDKYPISHRRNAIKKLSNYESINGNHYIAIDILYKAYLEAVSSEDIFMRIMEASIFIDYISTILKKLKIDGKEIKFEASKLHMVALAIQGRLNHIDSRLSIGEEGELYKYFNNNLTALEYFASHDFLFLDPLERESIWKNDKIINNYFNEILSDINEKIKILISGYQK